MLTSLLAPMIGLKKDQIVRILSDYAEELEQLSYNWKYVSVGEKMDRFQQAQISERDRILDKVAQMTVEDNAT